MSEENDRSSPHAPMSSPGLTRGPIFGPESEAKMGGRVRPGHDVGRGRRFANVWRERHFAAVASGWRFAAVTSVEVALLK